VVPIHNRLYSSQTPSTGASEGKKVVRKKVSKVAAMSEQEAEHELKGLNTEIVLHDRRYYEDAAPIITDGAYDKLIRRAESLVGKYPHLGHLVPKLSSVGLLAKSSKLEDFKHTAPMLSLNNCFSKMDLMSFFAKSDASIKGALSAEEDYPPTALDTMMTPVAHVIEYVVEPKIDGLSLSLHYSAHSGALLRAGTRGDGRTGEDVTRTLRRHVRNTVLASLPSHHLHAIMAAVAPQMRRDDEAVTAPPQAIIEVRGEIYMSKLDLQEMNRRRVSSNEGAFSTARNAAAGSLRRVSTTAAAATQHGGDDDDDDDPSSGGGRGLSFYAYSLSLVQQPDAPPMEVCPTQSDTLSLLQAMGFSVARPWTVCRGADEVHRELTQWELDRPRWAFDADGAVVKVNLYRYHKYLGCSSRAPRWALAFKFAGNSVVTRLRAIEVQVGRTGVLTPVGRQNSGISTIIIMI
jgi:DNA ligase (NAD+)